jgi:hypothetical protein
MTHDSDLQELNVEPSLHALRRFPQPGQHDGVHAMLERDRLADASPES